MSPEGEQSDGYVPAENETSPFSYEGSMDPRVLHYRPHVLGGSGEHIVYDFPEGRHLDTVVKIKKGSLTILLQWDMALGEKLGTITSSTETLVHEYISTEQERLQTLRQYFGPGEVPKQKMFYKKIPVTDPMLQELFPGDVPADLKELPAIIVVQEKIPELQQGQYFSLTDDHALGHLIEPESYEQLTDMLVLETAPESDVTKKVLVHAQENPWLAQLLDAAEQDPALQEKLQDLVRRLMRYTEETGDIPDLAEDNVILFRKDGEWQLRLGDALFPYYLNKNCGSANEGLRKLQKGKIPKLQPGAALFTACSYQRTLNGIAALFGMPDRLRIFQDTKGITGDMIYRAALTHRAKYGQGGPSGADLISANT